MKSHSINMHRDSICCFSSHVNESTVYLSALLFIAFRYLFGENVEGSAFVVFGVNKGKEKISIQSSLNRVNVRPCTQPFIFMTHLKIPRIRVKKERITKYI